MAEPNGTLWLEAPDWSAYDELTRRAIPWARWRIGFQSVVAHWMDEAVRRNVARVEIVSPDRPDALRQQLGDGAYWSREVRVHDDAPADAPEARESMANLPGLPELAPPTDGTTMIRYWLETQLQWLQARHESVSLDRQLHPRVWVGPGVQIHPAAKLSGPCWIGSRSQIGADTQIGPHAIIGTHACIDGQASVENAVVEPDTYVGSHLHLDHMIADGAALYDARRGTRVEMTDRFMLARLRPNIWEWLTGRKAGA